MNCANTGGYIYTCPKVIKNKLAMILFMAVYCHWLIQKNDYNRKFPTLVCLRSLWHSHQIQAVRLLVISALSMEKVGRSGGILPKKRIGITCSEIASEMI